MKIDGKHLEIIEKCPFFSAKDGFSTEEILDLLGAEIKEYQKGEFIHKSGEPFSGFGMLLSGTAQACIDDIDGNRMIMADINVGITFGESLCYLGVPDSPVYVFSSEKSEVLWLYPENVFSDENNPLKAIVLKNYARMLAERTLSMNTRIQVLSKLRLKDKILTYLSSLANDTGSKVFTVPLTREDMATYIGANRTALSRELAALKKDGIIDYYRNTFKILK